MAGNNNIRILGISGSDRDGSFNTKLLGLAIDSLKSKGVDAELFDVRENRIPLYSQDAEETTGFPESVLKLWEAVAYADAIIFASPEFNAGYTPLLKSIIDWLSRKNPKTEQSNAWHGKPLAVISASPSPFGGSRGQIALRQTVAHVGMLLITESTTVPSAYGAFNDDGTLKDERSVQVLNQTLDKLVEVAGKLKG